MVYRAFVVFWPYKHNDVCIFSVQCSFMVNKIKETSLSLLAMKRHWTDKHIPLCL